jgi:hypothetical protein
MARRQCALKRPLQRLSLEMLMRWKISPRGHDPRQIDLIAILASLILIAAACRFFSGSSDTPSTTVFIVPSQSVRW